MRDATPLPIHLADYTPFPWIIEAVALTFVLHPTATRVRSKIRFAPNPAAEPGPFVLDGEKMKLISASINGTTIDPVLTDSTLACSVPEGPFTWEAEVEINPEANTALDGLYMSNGMYCTQCEAEGFRKITYYPDRPDVLATFDVRVEGDLPILLSNGNPGASGDGWAEWRDPWPKPSYLFALVAGDLVAHTDNFTTCDGRAVDLNIWVRPGDEDKCAYAMDALKRSMTWDEDTYGRAYDLDVFNIVAVDDFNMGAMENKGLNIFNSKYVLASPQTATDRDYELIEGIIAHEYFHNWTGNRITCRDWFQLCLKEGLTVFRDQQFSGDMRGHAVKRIDDVLTLRARQFREDAGPLAHPVRPESYIEINNFYTATVYEKGAEIIGMLKVLVGDEAYDKALSLYFSRHDGDAATIEDWLKVFEDVTGQDLSQFKRWYAQAGTPHIAVSETYKDGTYEVTFKQETPPTPGQSEKHPQVIPIAMGLLNPNGSEARPTDVIHLTQDEQTFTFSGLTAAPVPSFLRGFSAPVVMNRTLTPEEHGFLLSHDTDPFNRWEAGRSLARATVIATLRGDDINPALGEGLQRILRDDTLDPAFKALTFALPAIDDIAQSLHTAGQTPDPGTIHQATQKVARHLADALQSDLQTAYEKMDTPPPYTPEATAAGKRALRDTALKLISLTDDGALARAQFSKASDMTTEQAALAALISIGAAEGEVEAFYRKWTEERLVIDKWFALQTSVCPPSIAVETTQKLTQHADFEWKNPNRLRAALGGLISNAAGFHDPSGRGYSLIADWLIKLDPINPQTTARLSTAFETWRRFDADRQDMMQNELRRIADAPDLSRDTSEMVQRMLG